MVLECPSPRWLKASSLFWAGEGEQRLKTGGPAFPEGSSLVQHLQTQRAGSGICWKSKGWQSFRVRPCTTELLRTDRAGSHRHKPSTELAFCPQPLGCRPPGVRCSSYLGGSLGSLPGLLGWSCLLLHPPGWEWSRWLPGTRSPQLPEAAAVPPGSLSL